MQTLNRILQKVAQVIFKGFFVFATAAFAFLLAILLINVFSRNFLDGSIAAIEEGSRFVFTWMMFLGISIGVYRRKHLGVDFLVEKYPKMFRRTISLLSDLLTVLPYHGHSLRFGLSVRAPVRCVQFLLLHRPYC